MGVREKNPELKKLKDAGKHVYSFSKLSSIGNCPYGAYLSYIKHEKNRKQSIWGVLGEKFHDKLEEITNHEADSSELQGLVGKELSYLEMLDLDFPKDFRGGDSIRQNWIKDMEHFSKYFEPLEGEFDTEEFVLLKVDEDHYLQGYVDLIRRNDDGTISIMDWKTSGLYDKAGFEHAAHQLKIYGLAKEAQGFEVKDLAWIFLKYVEVSFMGKKRANSKNDALITKVIERRKLVEELVKYIEADLMKAGYDEIEANLYIIEAMKTNSLEKLPPEIIENYDIKPYICTASFDEEEKQKTWDYIRDTIKDFESRGDVEDNWEHRDFTIIKNGKEVNDTFFCNSLCDFGNSCKYIKEFNEKLRAEQEAATQDDDEEWF